MKVLDKKTYIAIKKLIRKTSLTNLQVKDFRGSVISRELKKLAIKHPLIYFNIFKEYQEFILQQSNLKFLTRFAENYPFLSTMDLDKLGEKVCEKGTIQEIFDFIQAVPNVKMKGLTKQLLRLLEQYTKLFGENAKVWFEAGYPFDTTGIYDFKSINEKLDKDPTNPNPYKYVIELRKYDDLYFKNNTQETIENKKTEFLCESCFKLATTLNGVDIPQLENTIIEYGSINHILRFARDVKGVNIEKFQDVIVKTKDLKAICDFAQQVKGADINTLQRIVAASKDPKYIYTFATQVRGANTAYLQEYILDTNNAQYLYYFARDIKNIELWLFEETIIKTKNLVYIEKFMRDIKGANKKLLAKAIKELEETKVKNTDTRINL